MSSKTRNFSLTNGRSSITVDAPNSGSLPTNSGPESPLLTPRSVPPEIIDGVAWLVANQRDDGSWQDSQGTRVRDTSTVLDVLHYFDGTGQAYDSGIDFLTGSAANNYDYLARKILTLSTSGQNVTELSEELISLQNDDGGWGGSNRYLSNPTDTSLVLQAYSASGILNQDSTEKAIQYLKQTQNIDGGWGGNGQGSDIHSTVNSISALTGHQNDSLAATINSGVLWLLTKRNSDGGFGNSPSTIYDTAQVVEVLKEYNASDDVLDSALNYVLNLQSADGSWYGSPYQTALAVNAIWIGKREADLAVATENIQVSPSTIFTLPTDVTLSALVENSGLTSAENVKVALYKDAFSQDKKIGEQFVDVPGGSSASVTFTSEVTEGRDLKFYIVADPENTIPESSESNNIAIKAIYPDPTVDFVLNATDLVVSQSVLDVYQDVQCTVSVKNVGTRDAQDVPISLYIETESGSHAINSTNFDIPSGQTVTSEITWRADVAGDNLKLIAEVDPADYYSELSEGNNKALSLLTIHPTVKPNLIVRSGDVTLIPSPALRAGSATVTAIIKNSGFSTVNSAGVDLYLGVPDPGGVLVEHKIIDSLDPGSEVTETFVWNDIPVDGEQILTVLVDAANEIDEILEDDNSGFVVFDVLSLPDLQISSSSIDFDPSAPKEGEMVDVAITVVNKGDQSVDNVPVSIFKNGTALETKLISSIAGNSQASTTFALDTSGDMGAVDIQVSVDPNDEILEVNIRLTRL